MPKTKVPRRGSLQYYPRSRAKSSIAKVRYRAAGEPIGEFAGYKVGMTHVTLFDNSPNSPTKGEEIAMPATVIECPPLKVMGVRAYKNGVAVGELKAEQAHKHLGRRLRAQKKKKDATLDGDQFRLLVHTQPYLTKIGKKKPEVFEICLAGTKEQQLSKAKELLGKDITLDQIFASGQQVDTHSITKGKGTQGPVKRFGIGIKQHKSEKTKRGPGSLGPWKGQGHIMWKVAHAGQLGFQQRTEHNKLVIGVGTDPKRINPKGGFLRYGFVNNHYMLLKGSVPGAVKRLIKITKAARPNRRIPTEALTLEFVSLDSKQ